MAERRACHAVLAVRAPRPRLGHENTEVRVVQDERALYFGVICHDTNPKGIIAQDMRRDAPLSNDDYIGIYLDTYHDHRNFYYFSTNSWEPAATASSPMRARTTRRGTASGRSGPR